MRNRGGVTLIELIVVLAILAIGATIVGLAVRATPLLHSANSVASALAAVRDSAIRTRRSVTMILTLSGSVHAVTALPDGRVIADSVMRARLITPEGHRDTR